MLLTLINLAFLLVQLVHSRNGDIFPIRKTDIINDVTKSLQKPRRVAFAAFDAFSHVSSFLDVAVELKERNYDVYFIATKRFKPLVESYRVRFIDIDISQHHLDEIIKTGHTMLSYNTTIQMLPLVEKLHSLVNAYYVSPLIDAIDIIQPQVLVCDSTISDALSVKRLANTTVAEMNLISAQDEPLVYAYLCGDLYINATRLERIMCPLSTAFHTVVQFFHDGIIPTHILYKSSLSTYPISLNMQFPGFYYSLQTSFSVTSTVFGGRVTQLNASERMYGNDLKLKYWLDSLTGQSNVVYMSFGNSLPKIIGSDRIPRILSGITSIGMNIFVAVSLPQDYHSEMLQGMEYYKIPRSRVYISSWVNQILVLNHHRTAVFITHGGQRSMMEAIAYQVPVLVIPAVFDQHYHAQQAERVGIGLWMERSEFNGISVRRKLELILSNYGNFVTASAKMNRLRILSGLTPRAADLIESSLFDRFLPEDAFPPGFFSFSGYGIVVAGFAAAFMVTQCRRRRM